MSQAASSPDPEWKGLYKIGAISLILAGILVLATIPLIPILIPSLAPTSTQAGLQSLQSQSSLYGITWGLYLVSDLLFLIAIPALYFALKQINRAVMLIALIFNTAFVVIDVGTDIPLRISLIGLSNGYTAAQNATSRSSYIATAQLTMDLSNVVALVATFLQFTAIILAAWTMLKSTAFKKSTGYVGILCGILALLFIPTFAIGSMISGLFNIAGFILLVIWSLIAGYRLYKLG